jgi:hypothetical protein
VVLGFESIDELGEGRRIDPVTGEVHLDVPALAGVANVGGPLPLELTDVADLLREHPPHFCVQLVQENEIVATCVDAAEADVVELLPREQQAGGREEAGERRHEHGRDTELLGECGRVHRAGAAVGDQRELARVTALLRRNGPQRAHHRRVRKAVDAARRVECRQLERLRDAADRPLREIPGDVEVAAGEAARRDIAEIDVGVGDGGLVATASIAGRARIGSGAPRSDVERSSSVEPREAAAARADFGDVDGRDADQLSAATQQATAGGERCADLVLAAPRHAAVLDQRRLRRRTAHVERDRVGDAELLGEPECGHDSGGRTRLEGVHRPCRRISGGHHAARRLHDRDRRGHVDPPQTAAEVVEVPAHQRADVGVDGGCGSALVLLLLADDLARERHVDAGKLLAEDRACALLVLWMPVRVQEADGNRLDVELAQPMSHRAYLVVVEAPEHLAGSR